MKFKVADKDAESFFKKLFFLAYEASVPMGLDFLHFRDDKNADDVWEHVAASYSADYVFGRMMKLYVRVMPDYYEINDNIRSDYQSWCSVYPTTKSLLDAVGIEYTPC